jgi:serine/threonine protein kinase
LNSTSHLIMQAGDMDLHEYMKLMRRQKKKIPPKELQTMFMQLCIAVLNNHNHGIIHRDMKPSNILMVKNSTRYILKLSDYGHARLLPTHSNEPMTPHLVTMWWRAPEMWLGSETYGKPVDIWSLGCILADLATLSDFSAPPASFRNQRRKQLRKQKNQQQLRKQKNQQQLRKQKNQQQLRKQKNQQQQEKQKNQQQQGKQKNQQQQGKQKNQQQEEKQNGDTGIRAREQRTQEEDTGMESREQILEIISFEYFMDLYGVPDTNTWPKVVNLPGYKRIVADYSHKLNKVKEVPLYKEQLMNKIHPDAFDLLKRIFQLNPEERIDINGIMCHPYVVNKLP